MAAYAGGTGGVDSATLHPEGHRPALHRRRPAASAISTFSRDTAALGELPGTCAHYVVDYSGVAYQLVPTSVMCRHAIGLNHVAIGIEVVQPTNGHSSAWADQQILARTAQVGGLLALVRSFAARVRHPTTMVYGHATANSCPLFRDLQGWRNDHTDWGAAAVTESATGSTRCPRAAPAYPRRARPVTGATGRAAIGAARGCRACRQRR